MEKQSESEIYTSIMLAVRSESDYISLLEHAREHALFLSDWLSDIRNRPELRNSSYIESYITKAKVILLYIELASQWERDPKRIRKP